MKIRKIFKNYSTYLFVFLLFLLSLGHLVFAFRTDSFFSVDDFAVLSYLKDNALLTMVWEFLTRGDVFGFRKVVGFLFFGIIHSLFGTDPNPFIISNFLFHTLNLFLLFLVVKRLTKRDYVAFFISLIFNKYYLFYFSNIHEYSATFFCLLSMYLFLKFSKKTYLSAISFVLALLSKELAFSLPFFLAGLSFVQKKDLKRLFPHFALLALYAAYQFTFWIKGSFIPKNTSYAPSFKPADIVGGIFYYLDWKLLSFLFALPFLTNKRKTLVLLFVGILTLLPAAVFGNRRELYYVYLPAAYILIYLGVAFPKSIKKAALAFLVALFLFGGRAVFPKIAWQQFPNHQKEAVKKVLDEVERELSARPGQVEIDLSDIDLQRDVRLMLESGVLGQFVSNDLSQSYTFFYKQAEKKVVAEKDK